MHLTCVAPEYNLLHAVQNVVAVVRGMHIFLVLTTGITVGLGRMVVNPQWSYMCVMTVFVYGCKIWNILGTRSTSQCLMAVKVTFIQPNFLLVLVATTSTSTSYGLLNVTYLEMVIYHISFATIHS